MEQGIVIEIRDNRILVETAAAAWCAGCPAGNSCVIGSDSAKRRLWMDNDGRAGVGDEVAFEIAEKAVILSAAVVYLVPVIMLIAGILSGAYLGERVGFERDVSSIGGGAAGLLVSVLLVWSASQAMKRKKIAAPRLVDITRNGTAINCR